MTVFAMDAVNTIALTMGIAWASGINLYAAILMLGLLGNTGNISLPPDLVILHGYACRRFHVLRGIFRR